MVLVPLVATMAGACAEAGRKWFAQAGPRATRQTASLKTATGDEAATCLSVCVTRWPVSSIRAVYLRLQALLDDKRLSRNNDNTIPRQ